MSKKNKENLDNLYNKIIRELCMNTCLSYIQDCNLKYNTMDLDLVFLEMKNIHNNLESYPMDKYLDLNIYIDVLNYIEELFYIERTNNKKNTEHFINIRKRFIPILREKNIKAELHLYAMYVGQSFLIYESEILQKNKNITQAITGIISIYCEFLTTYLCKFKNLIMNKYSVENTNIIILYEKTQLFYKEELIYISNGLKSQKQDMKFEQFTYRITEQFTNLYYKFFNKIEDKGDIFKGYVAFNKEFDFPFFKGNDLIVNPNKINTIHKERKYAIYSNGIKFNVKNKEYVDYIEMNEDTNYIYLHMYLINNNDIMVSKERERNLECYQHSLKNKTIISLCNKTPIKEKLVKFSFFIDKKRFNKSETFEEKILSIQNINFSYWDDMITRKNLINQRIVLLCCIYMAYCDPKMFSNEIELSIKRNKKFLERNRNLEYRTGFIRKLPIGQNISNFAKENAKREGFNYIPEGYTYVKTFKLNDSKEKIINID